jgi:hypothetical protein
MLMEIYFTPRDGLEEEGKSEAEKITHRSSEAGIRTGGLRGTAPPPVLACDARIGGDVVLLLPLEVPFELFRLFSAALGEEEDTWGAGVG